MPDETAPADFPIVWDDPADAERCWQYDAIHSPKPQTPLGYELAARPFVDGFGWNMRQLLANFYVYYEFQPPPAKPDGSPPTADPERLVDAARKWRDEILPEVLDHEQHYATADFDSMSNDELVDEIDQLVAVRHRSGRLHTLAITPHWLGLNTLIETYKQLTGGDTSAPLGAGSSAAIGAELGALRLVQGHGNKSVEAGVALWLVAKVAAQTPAVRERLLGLTAENAVEGLAELESLPEAADFVTAFRDYLDEFGWRAGGGFAERTWIEHPVTPLGMLRSYLEAEDYDPIAEQRRLADEREAAIAETMAQLSPEQQQQLQTVLDAAVGVAALGEDHNYYIDQRLYMKPRRLVLACARRLIAAGALDEERDVWNLRVEELRDALRGETAGVRGLAKQRKADLERWSAVRPPAFVGAPPPPDAESIQGTQASGREESADGLIGQPASAGVARGPVRVIADLRESARLRPGDVLVAQSTTPPWTPLFPVASAVVTEAGGVLGHTAVVAREYGIPAVLNVRDATRRLKDGQLVEVDGAAGTIAVVG